MNDASPELLDLQAAVVGRYSLVRELGRGGMGIVFLARDVALDRLVAIKLLAGVLGSDATTRARFLREARTAARLSHPNIVPVHSVEETGSFVFFVMAYVEGETLADRVERAGPLDALTLQRVTREVAWALGYAHGQGVVHRDVKPENILLERLTGRALVADFGIAQSSADAAHPERADSSSRAIVGTPRYMSPEQLSGLAIDGRSDLYSLGLVLSFAATGEAPPTVMQRLQGARVRIPDGAHGAALAPLVEKCLAADPAVRFADAESLLRALELARGAMREINPVAAGFLAQARAKSTEIATSVLAVAVCFALMVVFDVKNYDDSFLARLVNQVIFVGIAIGAGGYAVLNAKIFVWLARRALASGETVASLSEAARSLPHEAGGALSAPQWSNLQLITAALAGFVGWGLALGLYDVGVPVVASAGLLALVAIPVALIRIFLDEFSRRAPRSKPLGWLTRLALRLGGIRLRRDPRAVVREPTVAATAQLASEMFRALPPSQQSALGDVPALVRRLERAAVELRGAADTRRANVETALETIRLDLMRLHAKTFDSASITADLDRAIQLSEEVLRQVEARREVERIVRVGRTGDTPA